MKIYRELALLALAAVTIVAVSMPARAGQIEGKLVVAGGQPEPDRQVHFENQVSRDIFVFQTGRDGSFSIYLPPGVYDLRQDWGRIIAKNILIGVNDEALQLGSLIDPQSNWLIDFIEYEGLGEAVVRGPAPSTTLLPDSSQPKRIYDY